MILVRSCVPKDHTHRGLSNEHVIRKLQIARYVILSLWSRNDPRARNDPEYRPGNELFSCSPHNHPQLILEMAFRPGDGGMTKVYYTEEIFKNLFI